jgi:hypothetical protein
MSTQSNQGQAWADVQLPYVVRYRSSAFARHFAFVGACFVAALVLLVVFESWVPAALPTIFGGSALLFTVVTWLHVRSIDHLRVERDGLTLVARDGAARRIPFRPELRFAVVYEQCCRSIVVTAGNDLWDRQHIVADMLDAPRGLTIYGLCDLMNDLSQGRAGAWSRQHATTSVRRPQDWYREPARISRLMFLAGSLAVGALFVFVLVFLEFVTWSLSDWISKPIYFAVKLALSLLFTYPAYRFLVVGRLRDLGEAATHGNAMGLIWNKAAGSFARIYLRRGTEGRNQFGPEPRV